MRERKIGELRRLAFTNEGPDESAGFMRGKMADLNLLAESFAFGWFRRNVNDSAADVDFPTVK